MLWITSCTLLPRYNLLNIAFMNVLVYRKNSRYIYARLEIMGRFPILRIYFCYYYTVVFSLSLQEDLTGDFKNVLVTLCAWILQNNYFEYFTCFQNYMLHVRLIGYLTTFRNSFLFLLWMSCLNLDWKTQQTYFLVSVMWMTYSYHNFNDIILYSIWVNFQLYL